MSKNKNIESQYREMFNADIPEETWNSPSGDSWKSISKRIDKKKPKGSFWPILCLILAIASMGVFYHLTTKISKVQSLLDRKKIELETCSQKSTVNSLISSGYNDPSANSALTDEKKKVVKESVQNKVKSKTTIRSVNNKNKFDNNSILVIPTDNIKTINKLESIDNKDQFLPIYEDIKAINPIIISQIDFLSTRSIYPSTTQLKNNISNPTLGSFITVSLEGSGSSIKSEGMHTTVLSELLEEEYGELSHGLAVIYTRQINSKLYLSGGLSLRHRKFRSNFDLTLDYNHNQEVQNENLGNIQYNHSLPTFSGDVDTDLILSRSLLDNVNDSEKVNLDFDTKSSLVEIGLPISLRYFTNDNMTGYHFGLHLDPYYILNARSQVHGVISHHENIFNSHSSVSKTNENLSKILLNAGFTTGYDFRVNDNTSLGINVNYSFGLNNLYQADQFSSTTNILSGGLSITRKL